MLEKALEEKAHKLFKRRESKILQLHDVIDFLNLPSSSRKENDVKNFSKFFDLRHIFDSLKYSNNKNFNIEAMLNALIKNMNLVRLKPGDVLFKIGDPADIFFLILKGKVSLQIAKELKLESSQKDFYDKLEKFYYDRDFALIKYTIARNRGENCYSSFSEFIEYKILCIKKYIKMMIKYENEYLLYMIEKLKSKKDISKYNRAESLLSSQLEILRNNKENSKTQENNFKNNLENKMLYNSESNKRKIISKKKLERIISKISDFEQKMNLYSIEENLIINLDKMLNNNFKKNSDSSHKVDKEIFKNHKFFELSHDCFWEKYQCLEFTKGTQVFFRFYLLVILNFLYTSNIKEFEDNEELNYLINYFDKTLFNDFYNNFNISLEELKKEIERQNEEKYEILNKLRLKNSSKQLYKSIKKNQESKDINSYYLYNYQKDSELLEGNYFGEFSISNDQRKRQATVIIEEDTLLGYIDKHSFNVNLQEEKAKIEELEMNYLNKLILFSNIKSNNFKSFYFQKFKIHNLTKDELIVQQGYSIKDIFILREGNLNVYVNCSIMDIINGITKMLNLCNFRNLINEKEKEILKNDLNAEINLKNLSYDLQTKINLKKEFKICSLTENQIFGIEFCALNQESFYTVKVCSEMAKIYSFGNEYFTEKIFLGYPEAKINYENFAFNKLKNLLRRLSDLKNHFLNANGIKSNENIANSINNQLKNIILKERRASECNILKNFQKNKLTSMILETDAVREEEREEKYNFINKNILDIVQNPIRRVLSPIQIQKSKFKKNNINEKGELGLKTENYEINMSDKFSNQEINTLIDKPIKSKTKRVNSLLINIPNVFHKIINSNHSHFEKSEIDINKNNATKENINKNIKLNIDAKDALIKENSLCENSDEDILNESDNSFFEEKGMEAIKINENKDFFTKNFLNGKEFQKKSSLYSYSNKSSLQSQSNSKESKSEEIISDSIKDPKNKFPQNNVIVYPVTEIESEKNNYINNENKGNKEKLNKRKSVLKMNIERNYKNNTNQVEIENENEIDIVNECLKNNGKDIKNLDIEKLNKNNNIIIKINNNNSITNNFNLNIESPKRKKDGRKESNIKTNDFNEEIELTHQNVNKLLNSINFKNIKIKENDNCEILLEKKSCNNQKSNNKKETVQENLESQTINDNLFKKKIDCKNQFFNNNIENLNILYNNNKNFNSTHSRNIISKAGLNDIHSWNNENLENFSNKEYESNNISDKINKAINTPKKIKSKFDENHQNNKKSIISKRLVIKDSHNSQISEGFNTSDENKEILNHKTNDNKNNSNSIVSYGQFDQKNILAKIDFSKNILPKMNKVKLNSILSKNNEQIQNEYYNSNNNIAICNKKKNSIIDLSRLINPKIKNFETTKNLLNVSVSPFNNKSSALENSIPASLTSRGENDDEIIKNHLNNYNNHLDNNLNKIAINRIKDFNENKNIKLKSSVGCNIENNDILNIYLKNNTNQLNAKRNRNNLLFNLNPIKIESSEMGNLSNQKIRQISNSVEVKKDFTYLSNAFYCTNNGKISHYNNDNLASDTQYSRITVKNFNDSVAFSNQHIVPGTKMSHKNIKNLRVRMQNSQVKKFFNVKI